MAWQTIQKNELSTYTKKQMYESKMDRQPSSKSSFLFQMAAEYVTARG